MYKSATVKDVPAQIYVQAFAQHLKKSNKLELPDWHDIVKTGNYKELCPQDPDWYYIRAASIMRHLYLRPGTGIGAFTKVYGGRGRKTRSTRRPHFFRGAGGLVRHILKQLAELEFVAERKDRKGRFLTKTGQSELDTIASQVLATKSTATAATTATSGSTKPKSTDDEEEETQDE